MARIKGQVNYASNFEVLKQAPLDSRSVVSDSGDLIKAVTWRDADGNVWLYDGLIVVVPNTNNPSAPEVYVLKDKDNYGLPDSWFKLGADNASEVAAIQEILKKKANLANGKVPANELPIVTSLGNPNNGTIPSTFAVHEAISSKIVGLLNWQGVKDTTDEIKAITLAKKGDVWHSNEDGSEWVCTEYISTVNDSAWTELGTPIDLGGYYTKTEVNKKVKPLADSIGSDSDAASANGSLYARIKKNATDIYDYASKMSSGTLRDLYISAGAKYNEATGFYELNGLTDITEEEMRKIYLLYITNSPKAEHIVSWLSYPNDFRTNIAPRMFYISNIQNSIGANSVLEVLVLSTSNFYIQNLTATAHNSFPKLRRVVGNWVYANNNPSKYNFDYGQPFQNCPLLEEIRMKGINKSHTFAVSPNLSKESVLCMITNANPPSGAAAGSIAITLHPTAYARLKDDADIVAALEAKSGIVTLVSA